MTTATLLEVVNGLPAGHQLLSPLSELTTETYFDVIREPRTNNTMMFLKRLVVARP